MSVRAACPNNLLRGAACPPRFFMSRACIFVDGENLRHSLVDLFKQEFNQADYLPKTADWSGLFDELTVQAKADNRLRTYWYVVEHIDFWPYGLNQLQKIPDKLEKVLRS